MNSLEHYINTTLNKYIFFGNISMNLTPLFMRMIVENLL